MYNILYAITVSRFYSIRYNRRLIGASRTYNNMQIDHRILMLITRDLKWIVIKKKNEKLACTV